MRPHRRAAILLCVLLAAVPAHPVAAKAQDSAGAVASVAGAGIDSLRRDSVRRETVRVDPAPSTAALADLKTKAEIVKIAFEILALIIAGAWAIYGFRVFRQRQAAVTALRKSESEAASLELQAKRRAVLDISIKHDCRQDLASDGFILAVQVLIANGGVASAFLAFEDGVAPIRVHRITFDEAGTMEFPDPPLSLWIRNTTNPTRFARSRVIRAGGMSRLASAVRVPEAGVYYVAFRVPMDVANSQAMVEAGASASGRHFWSATSIVCVGFPAPGETSADEPIGSPV